MFPKEENGPLKVPREKPREWIKKGLFLKVCPNKEEEPFANLKPNNPFKGLNLNGPN